MQNRHVESGTGRQGFMKLTIIHPVTDEAMIHTLSALAHEIWNQHYVSIIGQAQVDYMLDKFQSPTVIREQVESGHEYYLALDGIEPVAYMSVVPDGGQLMLSKIYVKAGQRSKGIGSRLLDLARARVRELNADKICLRVNRHNHNTMDWYQRKGFAICREDCQSIGGGFSMDDYILELWVAQGT